MKKQVYKAFENYEFHHLDYNSPDNFMIFCRNGHLEEYENGNWENSQPIERSKLEYLSRVNLHTIPLHLVLGTNKKDVDAILRERGFSFYSEIRWGFDFRMNSQN